jgi:hypothetical protein
MRPELFTSCLACCFFTPQIPTLDMAVKLAQITINKRNLDLVFI